MRNLSRFLLAAYVTVLGFFVFWPRPIMELSQGSPSTSNSSNFAAQAAHNVLYIEGYRELFGNFIMLIPVVFLIKKAFPRIKAQSILLICLFITISIEFLQIYIPGRVSDVRDIAVNTLGATIALGLLQLKIMRLQFINGSE